MRADINNVGPAFPHKPSRTEPTAVENLVRFIPGDEPGMTLRDYFAAKAMQGWLSTYGADAPGEAVIGGAHGVAGLAYAMADAMLKAREVKP